MPDWLQLESGSYRILADATYDWESWITADGQLRWVNPAVYRFTGYPVPACLKMPDYPLSLVHPDDRQEFEALLAAGMAGSTANDVEVRLRHRDGSTIYAAASWQPVEIPSMPPGLRISVRDISSRKAVEQTLKESEALYRSIVESAWEGIWLLDAQERTEFVNPRLAEILGVPRSALLGAPLNWWLYDEASLADWKREPADSRTARRLELRLRRANGDAVSVLVSTSPRFHADGEFAGQLMMVIDTASRAPASDHDPSSARLTQLADRDRQLQRLSDLGKLAAQVAHEINNPLAGVRNALRLLRDLPDDSRDVRQEFHRLVDQEIERISRIVQQMVELQHPAISPASRFDIAHELQSLLTLMRPTAELQHVALAFSGTERPIPVHLPAGELRQILFNLVMNAIDVSPPGGTVTTTLTSSPDCHVISIRDAGPGLSALERERLFEPFYTTKPRSGAAGHGMGLATCHALAQSIGVAIDVNSEPGHGAEFSVTLPASVMAEDA